MSDKTARQIVETGTVFEGVLKSEASLVVGGQVRGEVSAPALTVTKDASVIGKVRVNQLTSHGSLGGEIDAESVQLAGTVNDNTVIRSASLEVKLNESGENATQTTFGNCELYVGSPTNAGSQMSGDANDKHERLPLPISVN